MWDLRHARFPASTCDVCVEAFRLKSTYECMAFTLVVAIWGFFPCCINDKSSPSHTLYTCANDGHRRSDPDNNDVVEYLHSLMSIKHLYIVLYYLYDISSLGVVLFGA